MYCGMCLYHWQTHPPCLLFTISLIVISSTCVNMMTHKQIQLFHPSICRFSFACLGSDCDGSRNSRVFQTSLSLATVSRWIQWEFQGVSRLDRIYNPSTEFWVLIQVCQVWKTFKRKCLVLYFLVVLLPIFFSVLVFMYFFRVTASPA